VVGCSGVLGPWGSARERIVRGAGRLVRGWLRRIAVVAERVLAVLAAAAARLGMEFTLPVATADPVAAVVEMLGALAAPMARRLAGSCSPWRLAAVMTGGRLPAPAGPDLGLAGAIGRNTNSLWSPGP